MHPPTPLTQVQHLLQLLPNACNTLPIKHDITELSRFLTELSVCDYFFVTRKPSAVALASIFNAMEVVDQSRFLLQHKAEFMDNIRDVANMDPTNDEVEICRLRLMEMYRQGGYYQQDDFDNNMYKDDESYGEISPVCVSGGPASTICEDDVIDRQHSAFLNEYNEVVPTSLTYGHMNTNNTGDYFAYGQQ